MTMPTRTVTASFPGRGTAKVLFVLRNTVSDGTNVEQAGTQTLATLDPSGNLSQDLLCQDPSLDADPQYDWRPVFGTAEWLRDVVVPAGAGSVALLSLSPVDGGSAGSNALSAKAQKLTRTAVKTANYTAAAGDLVPCDTTSAAFTVTLPNAPAVGSRVAVKVITLGTGNPVTVACAGVDVFNKIGGVTTGTLSLLNQALYLQYDAGIWTVIADDLPLSDLDARFAPLTGSGAYLPVRKVTTGTVWERNSRGPVFAFGVDRVDDIGWFKTTALFTATDDGTTRTTRATPTGVTDATKVTGFLRFGASIYVTATVAADGFAHVFQSQPPSAGTVAWTDVLTTAGTNGIGTAIAASSWGSNDRMMVAEYGDPVGGPSLWRSPDGTTWTKVLGPIAGLRHLHAIAADPYHPGVWYLTAGDGNNKALARSTDNGDTWTWIVTDNNFQAVQISFTQDWVWFAADNSRMSAWVLDRNNPTVPIIASPDWHGYIAVPGSTAGRGPFDDGVTINASATFRSASAMFTANDVGRFIRPTGSPPLTEKDGIYITAYGDASTVTLNKNASGAATGIGFYVDGGQFYPSAIFGAVDPATGIYYFSSGDSTSGGNRSGLFAIPYVGGPIMLLEVYSQPTPGGMLFRDGSLWFHQASHPLLAVSA